jgi:surfactin synthase thioesterase subunit
LWNNAEFFQPQSEFPRNVAIVPEAFDVAFLGSVMGAISANEIARTVQVQGCMRWQGCGGS